MFRGEAKAPVAVVARERRALDVALAASLGPFVSRGDARDNPCSAGL